MKYFFHSYDKTKVILKENIDKLKFIAQDTFRSYIK